ncbi:MAG: type III pantothenate kinase [Pseudomonadota bacterium]
MLLTIDAGNTNTVFALFDDDSKMRGHWRISTDARRTSDEYAVWLNQLMALSRIRPIEISGAIIASVVPSATFNLLGLCRHHYSCEALIVGAEGVELGVEAKIKNPSEAGADRLVNTVGARMSFEPPLIVLDIGTATTFDVVDEDGNYAGGAIAPGPNPSLDALHQVAAKLPRIEIMEPEAAIGKSTIQCMRSGIFWGYVGLIEGIVARIKREYGRPMLVIGTGGLSKLFIRSTDVIDHIDDQLTMRGLIHIYHLNRKA